MAALTTGLLQHRDYVGSVEQSSGLAPEEDQVFTASEINALINGIDDHAPLIDAIKAITDALPTFNDAAVDAGSYWSAAKTIAEIAVVADALAAVTLADDDGYDTLQEIIDKLKAAETALASLSDVVDANATYDAQQRAGMTSLINANQGLATTAANNANTALTRVMAGTGSPEGAVTAAMGTIYERTDVGQTWYKATGAGNTGWVESQAAAIAALARANHTGTQLLSTISDSGALAALSTVGTTEVDDDAVTYAKIQNVVADGVLLGNTAGAGSIVDELTATQVRALLNVEDGATARPSGTTAEMDDDTTYTRWWNTDLDYEFVRETVTDNWVPSDTHGPAPATEWDAESLAAGSMSAIEVPMAVARRRHGEINAYHFGLRTTATGAENAAALVAALTANHNVVIQSGTYDIDGFVNPRSFATIRGEGSEVTLLKVTTAAPGYGISLGGKNNCNLIDIQIKGSGANTNAGRTQNLMTTGGNAYYSHFTRVKFSACQDALIVTNDMYWSTFTDCEWRDTNRGVVSATAQDFNAVTFSGCSFFHYQPSEANTGDALDILQSDGISLIGCQIQNQGPKFDGCKGVTISGGYYEAYSRAAVHAVNDAEINWSGVVLMDGSYLKFDESSAKRLTGFTPRMLQTGEAVAINHVVYGGFGAVVQGHIVNEFRGWECKDQAALDLLRYTTGTLPTRTINVDGHVEATTTSNFGCRFIDIEEISVYVKWRVISGTAKVQLYGTVDARIMQVNSANNSDWLYYRATSKSNTNIPAILFVAVGGEVTIEVDTIIVSKGQVYISDITRVSHNTSPMPNPNGNADPGSAAHWGVGQVVLNTAPTAGGYLGWVCITAGATDTWKQFGPISA